MKLKKVFVCILAGLMMVVPCGLLSVSADAAQLQMKTYVWDSTSRLNVETSDFMSGDILTIRVSTNSTVNIGALVLRVKYDPNKFEFSESSLGYLGTDQNVKLSSYESQKGTISVIYDTSTKNSQASGEFITMSFSVKTVTDGQTADFSLSVREAWDSTTAHNAVQLSNASVTVNLTCVEVPEEFLALVSKLADVKRVDTAENIGKAEDYFNQNLTAQQRAAFKDFEDKEEVLSGYGVSKDTMYEYFLTAKTRYYEYVQSLEIDKLNDAAKHFLDSNPVLYKELNQVTLADESAIETLASTYKNLESRIKKRLESWVSEKIPKLEEALEAVGQVAEFEANEKYKYVLNTDINVLITDASIILKDVNEALVIYETYNSMAKEMLAHRYEQLLKIKEKLEEAIKLSEEQAAIEAEAAAYQLVWLKVLSKNMNTVSLEDKLALELAIAEYKKLSDGAQEYLSDKYENMVKMLALLNNYEEIETEAPSTDDTPKPETTPGVTEVIKTVTEVNENTVVKYLKSISKYRNWLLILLLVASACAVYSYIYYENLRKKHLSNDLINTNGDDWEGYEE